MNILLGLFFLAIALLVFAASWFMATFELPQPDGPYTPAPRHYGFVVLGAFLFVPSFIAATCLIGNALITLTDED